MIREFRSALMVFLILTVVTGVVYPGLVTLVAYVRFPSQAGGIRVGYGRDAIQLSSGVEYRIDDTELVQKQHTRVDRFPVEAIHEAFPVGVPGPAEDGFAQPVGRAPPHRGSFP